MLKNVEDLGKLFVAKGLKKLPKVKKNRPIWSHWMEPSNSTKSCCCYSIGPSTLASIVNTSYTLTCVILTSGIITVVNLIKHFVIVIYNSRFVLTTNLPILQL